MESNFVQNNDDDGGGGINNLIRYQYQGQQLPQQEENSSSSIKMMLNNLTTDNQVLHSRLNQLEAKLTDYDADKSTLRSLTSNYSGFISKIQLVQTQLNKLQTAFNIYRVKQNEQQQHVIQLHEVDHTELIKSEPNLTGDYYNEDDDKDDDNDGRENEEFNDDDGDGVDWLPSEEVEEEEEDQESQETEFNSDVVAKSSPCKNPNYFNNNAVSSSPSSSTSPFQCPTCPKKYKYKHDLVKHQMIHYPGLNPYKCKTCGRQFHCNKRLNEHVNSKHPNCNNSSSRTSSSSLQTPTTPLLSIPSSSTTTSHISCKLCTTPTNPSFNTATELAQHYTTHHTRPTPSTSTSENDNVNTKTKAPTLLNSHLLSRPGKFLQQMLPPTFNKSRPSKYNVAKKVKPRLCCPYCRVLKFRSRFDLQRHTGSCPSVASLQCTECNTGFTDKAALEAHNKESHRKAYPCQECEKIYYSLGTYKVHLNVHAGIKPYLCSDCGYSTAHLSSYNKHVRIHAGTREHQCPICTKYYTSKGILQRHVRKVHQQDLNNLSKSF